MEKKIPLALIFAMFIQLAGGIWWVSQQASTISGLEETVSTLGSRMALEDAINTKRDVKENQNEINRIQEDMEDVWGDMAAMTKSISEMNSVKQRIAILENELKYLARKPRKDNRN
jgi:peptidoglycan hydrolase CwlO-like protein